MAAYVFGVARAGLDPALLDAVSAADAPVTALDHRDVAAVVTPLSDPALLENDAMALQRMLRSHSRVLEHLCHHVTILPLRFGTVFPDDAAVVHQLLDAQYRALTTQLDALAGAVEMVVKLTFDEQRLLGEVVAAQPRLRQEAALAKRSGQRSLQQRIDFGQRIADALQRQTDHWHQMLVDWLSPTVRRMADGGASGAGVQRRTSFLVDRDRLTQFLDSAGRFAQQQADHLQVQPLGPLPPYSFTSLAVPETSV